MSILQTRRSRLLGPGSCWRRITNITTSSCTNCSSYSTSPGIPKPTTFPTNCSNTTWAEILRIAIANTTTQLSSSRASQRISDPTTSSSSSSSCSGSGRGSMFLRCRLLLWKPNLLGIRILPMSFLPTWRRRLLGLGSSHSSRKSKPTTTSSSICFGTSRREICGSLWLSSCSQLQRPSPDTSLD